MTQASRPALIAFLAAVARIQQLAVESPYGPVADARSLPGKRVGLLSRMRIQPDGYYGRNVDPDEEKIAALVVERLRAHIEAVAKQQRAKALRAFSLELESLRAALPGLAAAASIEIGTIARGLAAEATEE